MSPLDPDHGNNQMPAIAFLLMWAALANLTSVWGDDAPSAPSTVPGRNVEGTIHIEGQPLAGAVITLCNAETGVPLMQGLRRTPTWQEHQQLFEDLWFANSDAAGTFQFENVPPGQYRLIAQQWRDAEPFEHPFEVRDRDVLMLGSMEIEVTEALDEPLEIEFAAAPGPSRLIIDGVIDEVSLILVSTEAPEDAALGPFAIAGPFATHLLGYCRGRITIEGLPDGTIGVTVFILDNSPGINTYVHEVAGGEEARINVREEDMLAGWSNARRTPLPGLEAEMTEVTALFAAGEQERLWERITADTPVAETDYDGLLGYSDFERVVTVIPALGDLRREIELPSGHKTTVGKALAAMAYCEIARRE